jgi:EmrB/QacA subfamily drug resistance transporter
MTEHNSAAPTETPAPAPKGPLGVLFVAVLLGALDIAILGPALNAIGADFQVDARLQAWLFTAFVLANLVGTPLLAHLADRSGRRLAFRWGMGLFTLGSLTVACSPLYAGLLLGRILQGIGAGGLFPVASAVIGDTVAPEKRGRALGLMGATFGMAFLVGPILGGLLLMVHWRLIFLINLPAALWVLSQSKRLPATGSPEQHPFDYRGLLLLAPALILLALGVSSLDVARLPGALLDPSSLALLLPALLLLPLFVALQLRTAQPIVPVKLIGIRPIAIALLLAAAAGTGESALVYLPSLAALRFGLDHAQASFALIPVVAALAIGAPLSGRLLDKVGPRPVLLFGTLMAGSGMIALAQPGWTLTQDALAGVAVGFGLSALLGAPLRHLVLHGAPQAQRASAQGLLTLSTSLGQLVSSAMVGALAVSGGGFGLAFAAVGGLVALLALPTLALPRMARNAR